MPFIFGIVWLVVSLTVGLLIRGNIFKNKLYYRVGLTLIALSFIGGFGLLLVILTAM